MMKTNIKMRVTPEQSKKVQEIVFANNDEYEHIDYQIEFIWIEPDLTVLYSYNELFYMKERSEEVDADLFIRTNGTCEEEPHIENCPECGSGDVEYCQISKRFYCNECKYWQPINYGTKADAIRKWNELSQKEEPHAELKRKYEECEYICIYPLDDTWITTYEPIWAESVEYKLIHKRHKEVLDHWLNGGKVESKDGARWILEFNFIDEYNEHLNYRIKQDQLQTRTFSTKKELAEALMRGEKWSPSIKYITFNHQFAEYNERIDGNPFRYGDNSSGFSALTFHWHYCDGKTLWTRVND